MSELNRNIQYDIDLEEHAREQYSVGIIKYLLINMIY
jgi:hypothetical protein